MRRHDEGGFTLIELLVAMALFSIVSVAFYQVMFSSVSGGDTAAATARISEEARHGFNRLVRDTREAREVLEATSTAYTVWVDFNGDEVIDSADLEYIRFYIDGDRLMLASMDPGADDTTVLDDTLIEEGRLIEGIAAIGGRPIFDYSSNRLQFDTDGDGAADLGEITTAVGSATALSFVSNVDYAFTVQSPDGEHVTEFFSQAQLRNKRFVE